MPGKPPVEPARLPYRVWQNAPAWQTALWESLTEGVTAISDFIGHPWRPPSLAADEHHVIGFPSIGVGTVRSALYQQVMGKC